jgi:hypothetical protein
MCSLTASNRKTTIAAYARTLPRPTMIAPIETILMMGSRRAFMTLSPVLIPLRAPDRRRRLAAPAHLQPRLRTCNRLRVGASLVPSRERVIRFP